MGFTFKGYVQTGNVITKTASSYKEETQNSFANLIKKTFIPEPEVKEEVTANTNKSSIFHREAPIDNASSNSSNFIKPKYVEDKSISYKSSSYLKELLGEGK